MNVIKKTIEELRQLQKAIEIPTSDDDLQQLRVSIRKHGILVPVIVKNNVIVDGLTRLKIAEEEKIHSLPVIELSSEENEKILGIELNLCRRHLSPAQKAEIISALLDYTESLKRQKKQKQAEENKVGGDKGEQINTENSLCDLSVRYKEERGIASTIAAITGVSPATVKKVKIIRTNPELMEKVKANELSIEQAYQETRRQREAQSEFFKELAKEEKQQAHLAEPDQETLKTLKAHFSQIRKILSNQPIAVSTTVQIASAAVEVLMETMKVFSLLTEYDQKKLMKSIDAFINKYEKVRKDAIDGVAY